MNTELTSLSPEAAMPAVMPAVIEAAMSNFGPDHIPAAGEQFLQRAFASFTEAAASLEISYRQLQFEVDRLRRELEKTNLDLEQAQEQLRRKQALAEMSAMLAHEVRNPLASMELLTALLSGSPLDAERREWLEQLQAGVRLLAATVNNVLQFHSAARPEFLPIELSGVLVAAERFLRPLAQQSCVQIIVEDDLRGAYIAGDRHCLQQVLFNLALNSFRAMPQGGKLWMRGRIEIGKQENKKVALLEVADTGCGIPPQDLTRIFEAGFSSRKGSPGIGLAVCREIVEHHRGSIRVASVPGEGSVFTLQFPIFEEQI